MKKFRFLSLVMSICFVMLTFTSGAFAGAAAKSAEKVKLKFTYWGSPDEKKAIESACQLFTQKTGIEVETIQIPNADYNAKMTAMAAGNDSPDTGYMTGDLGETWANEGKFVNLFDMFKSDPSVKKEDYLDYIWFKMSPQNAWGISTAGECFGLYYNKDLIKAAGVEAPPAKAENAWSWNKFVEVAKKLTIDRNGKNASQKGFDPKHIKQYGVMFETWSEPLDNFIFGNGGKWLSDDGKKLMLDQPEAIDAIQKLSDLVNVYHVAPSPLSAKSMPAMNIALQSKLTAMCIGGQWMNLDLGNAKVNFDIGVLPKLKKSITIGLSGASVIFKSSKHPKEAWELFKWMSNPEGAIDLYKNGLWMPTLKKWYTDKTLVAKWVDANTAAHPAGFKDAMMKQLMHNSVPQPLYYMKNSGKIVSMITASLDPVWAGKQTAAQALKAIVPKAQKEVKGRYDIQNK